MTAGKSAVFNAREFDHATESAAVGGLSAREITSTLLPVFRQALKQGRATLRENYLNGSKASDMIGVHAWLVDQLLKRVWKYHLPLIDGKTRIALVAVGGYGRGELYPASDIDLMLLLEKMNTRRFARLPSRC